VEILLPLHCRFITCILNISTNTSFTCLIYPSVCGWYPMLRIWVPKPENKYFRKEDVHFTSLSHITTRGIPWSWNISFIKISAISIFLYMDFTGIKWVVLFHLSTMTMMESFNFLVLGNLIIKSIVIVCHFNSRMGRGWSNPTQCWCFTSTCWNSKHFAKYLVMSLVLGQKKFLLIVENNFWYPGWATYVLQWNSSNINCLT